MLFLNLPVGDINCKIKIVTKYKVGNATATIVESHIILFCYCYICYQLIKIYFEFGIHVGKILKPRIPILCFKHFKVFIKNDDN